jgi:hypothetical protein
MNNFENTGKTNVYKNIRGILGSPRSQESDEKKEGPMSLRRKTSNQLSNTFDLIKEEEDLMISGKSSKSEVSAISNMSEIAAGQDLSVINSRNSNAYLSKKNELSQPSSFSGHCKII